MKKNKKSLFVIAIGIIVIILGIVLVFFSSNKKEEKDTPSKGNYPINIEKIDISASKFEGDNFSISANKLDSLNKEKICLFSYDTEKKPKICLDTIKDPDMDDRMKFMLNDEKDDLNVIGFNKNQSINKEDELNVSKENYSKEGYNKYRVKSANTKIGDYTVDVYYANYFSDSNKIVSRLFVFATSKLDNVEIIYTLKNKELSDSLINALVNNITLEENTERVTKSDESNGDLKVTLEKSKYYKEVEENGTKKIVEIEENEERIYYVDYSISSKDYSEVLDNPDDLGTITFEKNNKDYTLNIQLDGLKVLTNHDIVEYYKEHFEINKVAYQNYKVDENYKVGNKTLLKQEYIFGYEKYVEYYYIYKNGFFIKVTFKAKPDYNFDYDEIEKLLDFDIVEKTL